MRSHRTPPAKLLDLAGGVSDHSNFFQQDLDGGDLLGTWTVSVAIIRRCFSRDYWVFQRSGFLVFVGFGFSFGFSEIWIWFWFGFGFSFGFLRDLDLLVLVFLGISDLVFSNGFGF